ncbi:MAG: hypothetical protein STSR0009_10320 [Methanoregula sp.]
MVGLDVPLADYSSDVVGRLVGKDWWLLGTPLVTSLDVNVSWQVIPTQFQGSPGNPDGIQSGDV